jgi:hypothetical protein
LAEVHVDDDLRNLILDTLESCLDAQLRAVRRLRHPAPATPKPRSQQSLSQLDMAFDILRKARSPLHISVLLQRIQAAYGVAVDRESLVSSLSKKVARNDRFLRTDKNTFSVRPEVR